jgi:hypothetical protein
MGIAGMSVGMGILGESLGSEGLKAGGEATGKFIAPAVNISMGGYLINMIKGIKKKK